jgi:hypothetical protein
VALARKGPIIWSWEVHPNHWDYLIVRGWGVRFASREAYEAQMEFITVPHKAYAGRGKYWSRIDRAEYVVRGTGSWGHYLPGSGDE